MPPLIVLVAALAVLGLAFGPVLHHLGVRAAVRAPFDGWRPRCEHCAATSGWFRRRCARCGGHRRTREPLIWLVTALGAAGAGIVTGWSWLLPAHLLLVGFTVVLTVTDLDAFLLPNRVLLPGTLLSVGALAAGAWLEGSLAALGRGLVVGAGYLVVLGAVSLLLPHGFGMGDAKMAFMLGTFAGFWGINAVATMLLATAVLGGLPAIVLLVTGRASRDDHLPYGPAMIFGTWLAIALEGRLSLFG